jgi:hypothetical protein
MLTKVYPQSKVPSIICCQNLLSRNSMEVKIENNIRNNQIIYVFQVLSNISNK